VNAPKPVCQRRCCWTALQIVQSKLPVHGSRSSWRTRADVLSVKHGDGMNVQLSTPLDTQITLGGAARAMTRGKCSSRLCATRRLRTSASNIHAGTLNGPIAGPMMKLKRHKIRAEVPATSEKSRDQSPHQVFRAQIQADCCCSRLQQICVGNRGVSTKQEAWP
jgi:hypothetical protein